MTPNPTDIVCTGTVTVRALDGGAEWQEKVEVQERDIEDGWTPEDAARMVARSQAGGQVETLEADLS